MVKAAQAVLCYTNKNGWFRMLVTIVSGAFVAGGIYASTLSRVEALEAKEEKHDGVEKELLKKVSRIEGMIELLVERK